MKGRLMLSVIKGSPQNSKSPKLAETPNAAADAPAIPNHGFDRTQSFINKLRIMYAPVDPKEPSKYGTTLKTLSLDS